MPAIKKPGTAGIFSLDASFPANTAKIQNLTVFFFYLLDIRQVRSRLMVLQIHEIEKLDQQPGRIFLVQMAAQGHSGEQRL